MRLLICAGGTGGGVYPALAVWEALKQSHDPKGLSVLWVGSVGGMEADLVKRSGLPYMEVPAAGMHGVDVKKAPRNLWQIGRGMMASRRILKSFKPDILFYTGGYVAIPMAFSARITRINKHRAASLLYVPDIEPGLALKTIANFSDQIALTDEESKKFFSSQIRSTVCGYPVRPEISAWAHNEIKKQEAYRSLGITPDLPTVLIFGGSKGARSINQAVILSLSELLDYCQVIHISGQLDWNEVQEAKKQLMETCPQHVVNRYKAFAYLHEEMGQAFAVADLVVSRAGASILGEFPIFGVPAILVPYPYAWRYQYMNASHLERKRAAIIIKDSDLSQRLAETIQQLLNNPERLKEMKTAMESLAKPDAAQSIADLLDNMVPGGVA